MVTAGLTRPEVLEPMLGELSGRVVPGVIDLGIARCELVEKLALAVFLAGLRVALGHRDRLTERASALSHHHDHRGARWPLEHGLPFLG